MQKIQIGYDHINKIMVVLIDEQRYSVPVVITGNKHATIRKSVIDEKIPSIVSSDLVLSILKKYRNNKGNKLLVTMVE